MECLKQRFDVVSFVLFFCQDEVSSTVLNVLKIMDRGCHVFLFCFCYSSTLYEKIQRNIF